MKIRHKSIVGFLFLVIFLSYYVGTTAFIHTHFYPHYSITHSHPYFPGSDGLPHHTHTGAAFETIESLNSLLLDLLPSLFWGLFSILLICFLIIPKRIKGTTSVQTLHLRAPPASVYI